mgnify:CR=1 FL=1
MIRAMGPLAGVKVLEFEAIGPGFEEGDPSERSRVFAKIDEFLNENLYQYDTSIGDLKLEPAK